MQELRIEKSVHAEPQRRIKRWKHEAILDTMQARLAAMPDAMRIRKRTVEHTFGILKAWMGATHFQTRTLKRVSTEMSLHVLAYNLKRVMKILGNEAPMQAMRGVMPFLRGLMRRQAALLMKGARMLGS